jgi:hypothetical protein
MREKLGLDRPPFERYIEWLTSAVQGNFGVSLLSDKPVSEILGDRLYNTLFLAGLAAVKTGKDPARAARAGSLPVFTAASPARNSVL